MHRVIYVIISTDQSHTLFYDRRDLPFSEIPTAQDQDFGRLLLLY